MIHRRLTVFNHKEAQEGTAAVNRMIAAAVRGVKILESRKTNAK